MLTIFTTAKPFVGRIGVNQRNALNSWIRLEPRPQVLLFGDEAGAAEVARELGLQHIPHVQRSTAGLPLLSDMFAQADALAKNPLLCYVDADIVFMPNLIPALQQSTDWTGLFLMVGCSHTLEQETALDFGTAAWQQDALARSTPPAQNKRSAWGLDYFIFRKDAFAQFPPFVVGRPGWDNWFLYHVRRRGGHLIDATPVVTAIHQEHHFEYTARPQSEIWAGADGQANLKLVGGQAHLFSALDMTHVLTPAGLRAVGGLLPLWRRLYTFPIRHPRVGFLRPLLDAPLWLTRPIRKRLRLNQSGMASGELKKRAT